MDAKKIAAKKRDRRKNPHPLLEGEGRGEDFIELHLASFSVNGPVLAASPKERSAEKPPPKMIGIIGRGS
jgi:hypothetical protein